MQSVASSFANMIECHRLAFRAGLGGPKLGNLDKGEMTKAIVMTKSANTTCETPARFPFIVGENMASPNATTVHFGSL